MNDTSKPAVNPPSAETTVAAERGTRLHAEFERMVAMLAKPGVDIIRSLTPVRVHALHMAVGASGEAGELLDAIKKWVVYDKPLDRDNVIEELGDLEFYLQGLREGLQITREQTIEANIAKLSKRYRSGGYTDSQAQARADKPEGQ